MSSSDNDDKLIRKIDDPRLVGYEKRTRSGKIQEFYSGNDARDWERFRSEGSGIMHLKADTLHITPPKVSWYAKLVDGEWWWAEGCAECNGRRRDWMTYIECDDHNVCRTCKTPRSALTGSVWAGKTGWQCKPCAKRDHETAKSEALAAMPDNYDQSDYSYRSEIVCPYCNLKLEDHDDFRSAVEGEMQHECSRCDNTFTVIGTVSIDWTTRRIQEVKS